jgi:ABC-type Fe3+/spermidine/putrescine transport system ATPase subunit
VTARVSEPILQLEQVTKRFGRTVAADRLTLTIYRGEFFTLLGPSGSGKSTILRIIAGLEQPDEGAVLLEGRDLKGVPPWRRNLGMVFQHYAVFPHMTVAQNVGYGLRVRRLPREQVRRTVDRLLVLVGLAGMADKNVTLLSGGEQQRVALARALAVEPSLLLLDEPLSALDEKIRREMQAELKQIQRKTGTTFVYVTHDQEEALTMSDRIAVFDCGRCVQCGVPEMLFRYPRTRFVAGFFRGCNVVEADLLASDDGRIRVRFGDAVTTLPIDPPASPVAGGVGTGRHRVALAIRAENLHVGALARDCPTQLAATLVNVVYRGTNVDYVLNLEDGQRIVATSTRKEPDAVGQRVLVGLDPAAVVMLVD